MLYIAPDSTLFILGRLANVTVPLGFNAPVMEAAAVFAASI